MYLREKKIIPDSFRPGAKYSGFFRGAGTLEISVEPMADAKRAEFLMELAETGAGGPPSTIDDLAIELMRAQPGFLGGTPDSKLGICMGILSMLDALGEEEAAAAIALFSHRAEAGPLDGGGWDGVRLSLVPEAYRNAVREILLAEKEEREAVSAGSAKTAGVQLPFILCEHAKATASEGLYQRERVMLEKRIWDLDDDIAAVARESLELVTGRAPFRENIMLQNLSAERAGKLGLGMAIAELACFWQELRAEWVDDKTAKDAITALAHTYDGNVEPTLGALMILSEISGSSMAMIEPKLTIKAAAKKISMEG
ncbi:MAG: hypothetical protein AB1324_05815 [Candidatus Micrarchaeota archaeon]